ncbi:MAG: imidazole glycerol phosphate synthase subunit HisH [marine benthic group bacterium]|nr:imidazole glycerol phosphate synthase subunit HisH [Candidatus Benthicola marisminoris]
MIALVDYGAGNLRSVEFALEHLGVPFRRARDPVELKGAAAVILPGVGAAASAMRELEERGLADALRETSLPVLGVCLGLQLFTERSDEGEVPVDCLGLVPGETRRFGAEGGEFPLPLPHIGWNETRLSGDPLFEGLREREHFYYLHSYRASVAAEGVIAEADYGEPFPAAVRSGHRVAVQFHPEKSGAAGLRVLANFCGTELTS